MKRKDKKYFDDMFSQIAKENNTTNQQVRKDMQEYLDHCYNNGLLQRMGFSNHRKPTIEEWLVLITGQVMGLDKQLENERQAKFLTRHYAQ